MFLLPAPSTPIASCSGQRGQVSADHRLCNICEQALLIANLQVHAETGTGQSQAESLAHGRVLV